MPRKRGDDSDDDAPPASKSNLPASSNKKGNKKGNKDDDDEMDQVTKNMKKVEIKETDDNKKGGGNKKGGKGKRGDDSDDDNNTNANDKGNKGNAKGGNKKGGKGGDSDNDDDEQTTKKGKGKGKKGRRGDDSDDDDEDIKSTPNKGKPNAPSSSSKAPANNDDEDMDNDDDNAPYKKPTNTQSKSNTVPATTTTNTKKGGKNKKGKGKDSDSDDDDKNIGLLGIPTIQKGSRLKDLSDSDDEPKQKNNKKKDKKNKGPNSNKNRQDDDEEEEETEITTAQVIEQEEEKPAPAPAPVIEEVPVPAPAPVPEPTPEPTEDGELLFAGKKKSKKSKKFELTETEETTPATEVTTSSTIEETKPVPASETVVPTTEETGDQLDFGEKKKKKKKKGFELNIAEPEEEVTPSNTTTTSTTPHTHNHLSSNIAHTHSHSSTAVPDSNEETVFYGEAEIGTKSSSNENGNITGYTGIDIDGNSIGLDGEPIHKDIAAALVKHYNGESLSNKERKIVKQYVEDREKRGPVKAGGSLTTEGDEYGISNFSISQAGKTDTSTATANSKDIAIDNFSINAHKKVLFESASLRIAHGRRYGLVGPNGQGKSTLLKHMAARQLSIPARIDMLYVEQEVVADDTPAYESVLKADKKRTNLKSEAEAIEKELDSIYAKDPSGQQENPRRDAIEDRLNEIFEEMASMKTEASEGAARSILHLLGFNQRMQETPTKNFSGGWRMRISLARALFMQPDLLLLDEPTNHLDLNAVIGLEYHLTHRFRGTLLVVSHDQDFLSSVVDEIIHLEDKRLYYYKGSYDDFKEAHEQKVEKQQKDYEKQQKAIQMAKSKGKSSKDADDAAKSRAKRMGTTAKQDKKAAAANVGGSGSDLPSATDLIVRPKEYVVHFALNNPPELAPPILSINNVSFRYNDHAPYLFKNLNFGIDQSSRIAIVGPNGVGKSTLLNLLIGELNSTEGEVVRNRFLRVGKYSQHFVDVLPMDKTPVQFIQSRFPDVKYHDARGLLGRFGLEGHAHEIEVRNLSGGQKARVVFASLSLEAPHIMVLDEPTNNLDIESIDALGDAIREYTGGVVLVSHDARLIRNAECELWVCDKQTVAPFDGDIDDYRDSLIKDIEDGDEEILREAERKAAEEEEARMAALRERIRLRKANQEHKNI